MPSKLLTFVFFFFLITGCTRSGQFVEIITDEFVHQFEVEVVTSEEDKSQGLMWRESLMKNSGMLFVYNEERKQSFWMKNMLIPLDILFIDSDLIINHIAENVPPCTSDNCISYSSSKPAQYVLELSAGVSEKLSIGIGDTITLPH